MSNQLFVSTSVWESLPIADQCVLHEPLVHMMKKVHFSSFLKVFYHFLPCERMRKHAFGSRNTQQTYKNNYLYKIFGQSVNIFPILETISFIQNAQFCLIQIALFIGVGITKPMTVISLLFYFLSFFYYPPEFLPVSGLPER